MNKMLSRETGLTAAEFTKLQKELETGLPLKFAAISANINPGHLRKWIGMGQEGVEPFDRLYEAVERARVAPVKEQLENLKRIAKGPRGHQSATWLLERLDPESFAKPESGDDQPLEVVVKVGGHVGNVVDAED